MNLSPERIAELILCPASNVAEYWPLIETCLQALGIGDEPVCVAALATIAVETAHTFKPLHEYGSDRLHEQEYGGRLGNVHPGDGARYAGRGFIQITGEVNYEHYAKLLGSELLDAAADPSDDQNPEKACAPYNAAVILAAYFQEHKIAEEARAGRWEMVRRRVNGGLNGWQEFIACVNRLTSALAELSMAAGGSQI